MVNYFCMYLLLRKLCSYIHNNPICHRQKEIIQVISHTFLLSCFSWFFISFFSLVISSCILVLSSSVCLEHWKQNCILYDKVCLQINFLLQSKMAQVINHISFSMTGKDFMNNLALSSKLNMLNLVFILKSILFLIVSIIHTN